MNCVAVVFVFAMQFGFPSMLLVRNHIHHTHGAQAHPGECRYWDDGKIRFHGIRNERDVVGDGRGGCGGKKWIRPQRDRGRQVHQDISSTFSSPIFR
jgi:hypothetical protein